MKCCKIETPQLKNNVICNEDAVYIFNGFSLCESHGKEILEDFGKQVAQEILQQKISIAKMQAEQQKPQPKSSNLLIPGR